MDENRCGGRVHLLEAGSNRGGSGDTAGHYYNVPHTLKGVGRLCDSIVGDNKNGLTRDGPNRLHGVVENRPTGQQSELLSFTKAKPGPTSNDDS